MPLALRISQLSNALESGLYERQQTIRLCLLAALCGESVFLLGPPGIAKSMIARRMKSAFNHAKTFEYLMTRFSTPEEIFGPLSIKALKDEGRYERLIENYLPDAEVVFLDEIWKAGPAILNTLLTVINEKKFRNGHNEMTIPMRLLITASNELPDADNSLEALYDRMLIRIWLDSIQQKQNFRALLNNKAPQEDELIPEQLKITDEEYLAWQKSIPQISLSDHCFDIIYLLRQQINTIEKTVYISDRRWKKSLYFLRASAFFNGRTQVSPLDIILLKDCLWHDHQSMKRLPVMILALLNEEGWYQRKISHNIDKLYNKWIISTQDIQQKQSLKVIKNNSLFNRNTSYSLPDNIKNNKLTLFLHKPLQLHNIKVTFIITDRKSLNNFLSKGKALSANLNGIGFPQEISAQINNLNQIQLLDISHQTSTLYIQQQDSKKKMDNKKWLIQLDNIQLDIQSKRYAFEQDQPCLFIENHWLADIENSFVQLTDKLTKLRLQIMEL